MSIISGRKTEGNKLSRAANVPGQKVVGASHFVMRNVGCNPNTTAE